MPFPSRGVILYGPPASGKSTLGSALGSQRKWHRYRILRSGPTNDAYRTLLPEHPTIWKMDKYERTYAIDTTGFTQIPHGHTVAIELGESTAVEVVRQLPIDWTTVHIWCPRDTAIARMKIRNDRNIADRLSAWDRTKPINADLVIDTSELDLDQAVEILKNTMITFRPRHRPMLSQRHSPATR